MQKRRLIVSPTVIARFTHSDGFFTCTTETSTCACPTFETMGVCDSRNGSCDCTCTCCPLPPSRS